MQPLKVPSSSLDVILAKFVVRLRNLNNYIVTLFIRVSKINHLCKQSASKAVEDICIRNTVNR